MKRTFYSALLGIGFFFCSGCRGQKKPYETDLHKAPPATQLVGGGCDGCGLIYTGMPADINSSDTSAGWYEEGQKIMIAGTVYKPDGKTVAQDIIVYYYHTDNTGNYSKRNYKPENQTRHGHLRGWVNTDSAGKYFIYTIRPKPYPGRTDPAHIHIVIKEPALNEYYIDELVFDDDPLLTKEKRKTFENRGGSGILHLLLSESLPVAEHNIILGLNIPGYTEK